jgi:hypothetical protein
MFFHFDLFKMLFLKKTLKHFKKHLIAFTAIINQFLRIREAAIESKNNEMKLFLTYRLTGLLEFLFQGEDRDELINILLKVLTELRYSEQSLQEGFDGSLYFIRYIKKKRGIKTNLSEDRTSGQSS